MGNVAVVIVTYNRSALLEECLDAIETQTYRDYEIVLVDNHSTDQTEELARNRTRDNPWLHYYRLQENVGGAGGYQYGLRMAAKLPCSYVWLMDDDTICRPDALQELMQAAQEIENFGFLAGRVLWTDETPCKMNLPLFTGKDSDERPGVSKATFVSLLIPWSVVETVGLPIKEFFIWGDDQEYTGRISRRLPCFYVRSSTVIHKTSTNCGSDLVHDEKKKIPRYWYKYRNEMFISKRTGLASCLYYVYRLLRDTVMVAACSTEKAQRIAVAWKGFAAGVRFNPAIEYVNGQES